MKRIAAFLLVFGLSGLGGCVTSMGKRQFIPIGAPIQAAAKKPSEVQLFAGASQVPYSYIQMGRITPEGNVDHHQSADDQLLALRALAAAHGADAVIVSKEVLSKAGTYHGPAEGIVHRQEVAVYSGLAVIKTSTGSVVVPTPSPSGVVSIGDLFAVPDHYLDKTIVVEGIYSRLTVGSRATGFLLTSTLNSQLELLCAYRNLALDEASRRLLMNKPGNTNLRIEGHLVPSSQGSAKDAGMSEPNGYELAVTRILQ